MSNMWLYFLNRSVKINKKYVLLDLSYVHKAQRYSSRALCYLRNSIWMVLPNPIIIFPKKLSFGPMGSVYSQKPAAEAVMTTVDRYNYQPVMTFSSLKGRFIKGIILKSPQPHPWKCKWEGWNRSWTLGDWIKDLCTPLRHTYQAFEFPNCQNILVVKSNICVFSMENLFWYS